MIIYIITTKIGGQINVSHETFVNYLEQVLDKFPDCERKTFEHDLGKTKLISEAYFVTTEGKREVVCQKDTLEDNT